MAFISTGRAPRNTGKITNNRSDNGTKEKNVPVGMCLDNDKGNTEQDQF